MTQKQLIIVGFILSYSLILITWCFMLGISSYNLRKDVRTKNYMTRLSETNTGLRVRLEKMSVKIDKMSKTKIHVPVNKVEIWPPLKDSK